MKNNIISTLIFSVVLLLAGCTSDMPCEPEAAGQPGSLLSIDIDMEETSRGPIKKTSFWDGDSVFVIVKDSEHPDPLTVTTKAYYRGGVWVLADKIDLTGSIDGVKWTGAWVEAYYPYIVAAEGYDRNTQKINLTTIIRDQEDILYGSEFATRDYPKVTIHCKHALTRLTMVVKNNSSERVDFSRMMLTSIGSQSFIGEAATLDRNGIRISTYRSRIILNLPQKRVLEAGETYQRSVLIPPTLEAYDKMLELCDQGKPETVLELELDLNDGSVIFSIDAAPWEAGHQYTYPVNLFSTTEPDPEVPETEYVDLGLPSGTKWCTHNVGASTPEEIGGYYAWGETSEKSEYTLDNYAFWDSGYIDIGSEISGTQYDVAHVLMGEPWRMPTSEQISELYESCTWNWAKSNEVIGVHLIGPNGGEIFLPAAGFKRDDVCNQQGEIGLYWSGTRCLDDNSSSNLLSFFFGVDKTRRIQGLPVRAVFK